MSLSKTAVLAGLMAMVEPQARVQWDNRDWTTPSNDRGKVGKKRPKKNKKFGKKK